MYSFNNFPVSSMGMKKKFSPLIKNFTSVVLLWGQCVISQLIRRNDKLMVEVD